jgi:hypothetical protein
VTDPRVAHRHVVAADGDRLTYVCGCVNAIDPWSGWLRSESKCAAHRAESREAGTLGRRYYRDIGSLDREAPARYVGELVEALGPLPTGPGLAVEVGCGASPYAGAIRDAGWQYVGIDRSRWGCGWTAKRWGVEAEPVAWEDYEPPRPPGLILCAHAVEHMAEGPFQLGRMAVRLAPGGELWIVVPDDEDPLNPDHLWFPNADALRGRFEAWGLEVLRLASIRRIARESFLYARARRPADADPHALPVVWPGLAGRSWMSRPELAWLIGRLPESGAFVEVGTASGVSAARIADARPRLAIVCVDTFADADATHMAESERDRRGNWAANRRPNMRLHVGDLASLAAAEPGLRADAILVDAWHDESSVAADLAVADAMLSEGGVIFAHDYADPAHPGVRSAVDRFCRDSGYRADGDRFTLRSLRRI